MRKKLLIGAIGAICTFGLNCVTPIFAMDQSLGAESSAEDKSEFDEEIDAMLFVMAAEKGWLGAVKHMVEIKKIRLIVRNFQGRTALSVAAENGHLDVVQYLVERFAERTGGTPLRSGCFSFLCSGSGPIPLVAASKNGHLDVVKYLVEQGASVYSSDPRPSHAGVITTALTEAAENGHLDVVQYLVDHGTDPDTQYIINLAALVLAAKEGHLNVVRYLVDHEHVTNVDATIDTHGVTVNQTALLVAAKNGHLEVVRYLVEHGANIDVTDVKSGKTASMLAAENGHLDILNFFKELEDK